MTRKEKRDTALITRQKTFNRWWKKNGNLKDCPSKKVFWKRKTNQRALILSAKRTVTMFACSDLQRQIVFFQEKRFNNSEWGKLTKEDAWTMFKLANPTLSHRLELLQDTAEQYSKERQLWQDELKELRNLRQRNSRKKPTIQYKRKTA
jgi:hypothetical protein